MRILVTGGAGFIGSHYVRSLLSGAYPGHEMTTVTVLDKLTYAGNTHNLPLTDPRLSFVRGDVCDRALLDDLLPGHDAVLHFAAESHVDRSVAGATPFVTTNVLGTQTLLDSALHTGVRRIVHVSTDETEDFLLEPNSPYAASKAASDLVARAYWRTHGPDISITRCSNNYGPYQYIEKLIPLFATNLLQGRDVPLYGDGGNVREWLHVDDHCRALQLVLEKGRPGEVYNIGGGEEMTNRELTTRLLHLCGAGEERVRHVTDRKAHDRRYSLDDRKIRDELGYRPRYSVDTGLPEVVQWYQDNRWWWELALARQEEAVPAGAR